MSARATNNADFEAAKYLVVSNGTNSIDNTVYGTVRVGAQAQQVDVTFARVGSNLVASVALAAGVTGVTYQFTTQYQIIA